MQRLLSISIIGVSLLCGSGPLQHGSCADEPPVPVEQAAELSLEDQTFFEKSVRPVLINRCQECHSSDSPESELSVEHLADLIEGGTRGPAIVPGKPESSLLIRALSHGDVELQMPPKAKIPVAEIAVITDWIRRGAFWPGERAESNAEGDAGSSGSRATFTDEQLGYWSFHPPARTPLPSVEGGDWVQSPIDYFVLARLEQAGMPPAPAADRRTLIRRVYFDLLGLPPTPAEVAEFLNDDAPDAYPRLIERCLASPHYGERWGRYWLDVARYADSNGLDENLAYAHAYRYRDYVVAALNGDKPYDEFIHEQLAGDLLNTDPRTATTDVDIASQRLIATGFLTIGGKMLAEDDPVKMQMDIIDEQVDTLGKAFMGLTFGCARCHDHKFDPFTQDDYYGVAGIFKSTRTMENFSVVARWQEVPLGAPADVERLRQEKETLEQHKHAIADYQTQQNELALTTARSQVDRYLLAAQRAEVFAKLIASAAPQGDAISAATERAAGAQFIEAERFDRGNVGIHTSGYGEGIGVLVNQDEIPNFVEYDVEIAQAGTFQLEVRHAAAESRPARISINGRVVFPEALAQVTGSWYPDTQTWIAAGFVEFTAGKNTVRIDRDGPFSHIDKLLLVPVAGDVAASLAATAPSADDLPLPAAFVEGWRKFLGGTLPDDSPLRPAQRAWQGRPADEWFAASPPEVAALFGETLPRTFAELAQRYGEMLRTEGNAADASPTLAALRTALADAAGPFALPKSPEEVYPDLAMQELQRLRDEQKKLESELPQLPEAMAVSDAASENVRIHLRGSHLNLGGEVPRHLPAIFEPVQEVSLVGTAGGSGRLDLAQWLARPEHPLTSRVMVNRVWLWHFGKGLVRSPDNFGLLGESPTHPELLDWLAIEFAESGWSLKDLHRLILTSATYQMSTQFSAAANEADPENKLLWRMNRRRLDAEAIRDAILSVSGARDDQMYGSLLPTANRAYVTNTASVNPDIYRTHRRSLYLPVIRSALYEMFQAFDFADPSALNGQRDSTTVASQALFMMNSELVAQCSAALAAEIVALPNATDEQRVVVLLERVLGRDAEQEEVAAAVSFLGEFGQPAGDATGANTGWHSLCRALISSNEFLYVE